MIFLLGHFLVSAHLGDIASGDRPHRVAALLGEPEAIGLKDSLWKYGSFQIGFFRHRVSFLGIYFREAISIPATIVVSGYFPDRTTTRSAFQAFLEQEQVPYHVLEELTFGSQLCLLTQGKVQVLFDTTHDTIDSIQCSV